MNALILAVAIAGAGGAAAPDESGLLQPARLYNGVHRPLLVEIRAPDEAARLTLSFQAADGQILAEPIDVEAGRQDIAALIPSVWDIRRASYLQLLVDGEPRGSALVLQPMLTRMVPVIEPAVRADGRAYWHIAKFIPESQEAEQMAAALPVMEITDPALTGSDASNPEQDEQDADQADESKEEEDEAAHTEAPPALVFSGLRVYSERDVIMRTDHGEIRLAMAPDAAPNTAWNFLHLCAGGFFDDVVFHRVVPLDRQGRPFVIQAGDPSETGSGGPGYWLPMEPSDLPHDFGVISMARDVQPDSAGSQIFICLSREGTARLDGQYCAFGYAVDGAATIKSIADVELADVARGQPRRAPVIRATDLVPAPPRTPGAGRPDGRVTPEDAEPERTRPPRVPR